MSNNSSNYICTDSYFRYRRHIIPDSAARRAIDFARDKREREIALCIRYFFFSFLIRSSALKYVARGLRRFRLRANSISSTSRYNIMSRPRDATRTITVRARLRHARLDVNDFLGPRLMSMVARWNAIERAARYSLGDDGRAAPRA